MMLRSVSWCVAAQLMRQGQTKAVRGTATFSRMYPIRPRKPGVPRPYKGFEYVYILENPKLPKLGNMEVLLVNEVEGVGLKGEIVEVTKRKARNELMPAGHAVYASPENLEKYKGFRLPPDQKKISFVKRTIALLTRMNLPIPMNPKYMWTLDKEHVKVAFRHVGVQLNEDQIELPEEPITEPTDLILHVTINKKFRIPIRATVYFRYADANLAPGGVLPKVPKVWSCHEPSDVQTLGEDSPS